MTKISLRTVRHAFIMFLLALTTFAVAESAVGRGAAHAGTAGLSTCGSVDQPCRLEPVAVSVPARTPDARVAAREGLAACGSEAQPCRLEAVEVNASAASSRLASMERAVGMTLRVRS